jgi:hypothetical protein
MCRQVAILLGVLSGTLVLLGPGAIDAAPETGRRAVPDSAAQAKALSLIHDVYGKEYEQAKTSEQKTALARKLLAEADKAKAEPASYFCLLRVARDIAIAAGDAGTALDAVARLAAAYDVDALAMKVEAVEGAEKAARNSAQLKAVAREAFGLMDEVVAADAYEQAEQLGPLAGAGPRRGHDYPLARQIAARLNEVKTAQQEYQAVAGAREVLNKSPGDPDANLAVGRYLCLVKGDWQTGIPMLALGSDAALKALAVKELKSPDTTDAQVELGDGWWDLGQSKKGPEKQALMRRAGAWYGRARANLNPGLIQAKVEKRLRDIAALAPSSTAASASEGLAVPAQPVAVWQWNPQNVSVKRRVVAIDVSRWITRPGTCELRWQYSKGSHRLEIDGVVLMRNGRTVHRDIHFGFTGTETRQNTYTLKVDRVSRRGRFVIQASVRGDGGNDSYGTVWLQRLGD